MQYHTPGATLIYQKGEFKFVGHTNFHMIKFHGSFTTMKITCHENFQVYSN